MNNSTPGTQFSEILKEGNPKAVAWINGNANNPQLSGVVKFYVTPYEGVLIEAEVFSLPNIRMPRSTQYYAMHIHNQGDCSRGFSQTGEHYSKVPAPHPQHSGDMVPLLGNQGYVWLSFYDKRISIEEIDGKSIVIHAQPDDFTTQPSGNAGEKIRCGVIHMV